MASEKVPVVNLSAEAQLKGSIVTHDSHPVFEFVGIPFAESPVGDLRFKNPVPSKLWKGVREATEFGESSFKFLFSVSVPIAKQFLTINEKWVLLKFMKALGTFCV